MPKPQECSSPIVRAFCAADGGRAPADAAETAAQHLLARLGKTEPPFQVASESGYEFADLLNIPVLECDIACDGILHEFDHRYLIQVNRSAPPKRKNFTVCHEIGHYVLLSSARSRNDFSGNDL